MEANIPKSVPKKYQLRIAHWDDERSNDNSLIVSLKAGWYFPVVECHTQGLDTVSNAIEGLRGSETCACETCRQTLAAVGSIIPSGKIKQGDVLIEKKTGIECKVLETSEHEIAWAIPCNNEGAFGQCFRKKASSIFQNVIDEPEKNDEMGSILHSIEESLTEQNNIMRVFRDQHCGSETTEQREASLAVDDARNKIAAALHDLRRCATRLGI